jgi:hypothetical protein
MVPIAPVINAQSEVVRGSMGIRSLTAETVFYLVAALQSVERSVRGEHEPSKSLTAHAGKF